MVNNDNGDQTCQKPANLAGNANPITNHSSFGFFDKWVNHEFPSIAAVVMVVEICLVKILKLLITKCLKMCCARQTINRLSGLPEELYSHILSLAPTKNAIKTALIQSCGSDVSAFVQIAQRLSLFDAMCAECKATLLTVHKSSYLLLKLKPIVQPTSTSAINIGVDVHPIGDGLNELARSSKEAAIAEKGRASRNVRRRLTTTGSIIRESIRRGTLGRRGIADTSNNGDMVQHIMAGSVSGLSTTAKQHPGATDIIKNPGMTDRTCVPISRIFDRFRNMCVGNTAFVPPNMWHMPIGQPVPTSAVNVGVAIHPVCDGLNEPARSSEEGVEKGRINRNVQDSVKDHKTFMRRADKGTSSSAEERDKGTSPAVVSQIVEPVKNQEEPHKEKETPNDKNKLQNTTSKPHRSCTARQKPKITWTRKKTAKRPLFQQPPTDSKKPKGD
uniref:Uncharacterized protein n=1 Tax=Tanacetum cinerariifolium TaxID=118510 RepID=A0A6L2NWN5_TANCI|nr:hypothetical protein [Tanacetum cinerariifolium]